MSPDVHAALRRILHAFAKYYPTIGYTQGMNFLAVVLLHHLSEEQAFWVFAYVVTDRLGGIYGNLQTVVVRLLPPHAHSSPEISIMHRNGWHP